MKIRRYYRSTHVLILCSALANTALYCLSLPLWEGFDEPFHYGYVESLSVDHRIPALGRTPISLEIRTSLNLAPLSFILSRNIPGTISFEQWFALSQPERVRRAAEIRAIPPALRNTPSTLLNYEAQQAPLAYAVLAPLDAAIGPLNLQSRILILRLACGSLATVLSFVAVNWLGRALGLTAAFRLCALALFFEMQIYEASIAHVANDWLSITAALWFFAALAAFDRSHSRKHAFFLAGSLAVGLLAKAYFLAFVPVYLAALLVPLIRKRVTAATALISTLIVTVLAGPWYLRNLLLYRTLAGMQENVKGVNRHDTFYALTHIHWDRAFIESARWGLWTGNESHLSFSRSTLNLLLLLLLSGFILWLFRFRRSSSGEWWVLSATGVFVLALVYDLCVTWSDTHGLQTATGPYYTPCILAAVFALTFVQLQRSGLVGRIIASAISLVALWIALLTYFAKLLPYYGGVIGRSNPGEVFHWWMSSHGQEIFSITTLALPATMYSLLFCYSSLLLIINASLITSLLRGPRLQWISSPTRLAAESSEK